MVRIVISILGRPKYYNKAFTQIKDGPRCYGGSVKIGFLWKRKTGSNCNFIRFSADIYDLIKMNSINIFNIFFFKIINIFDFKHVTIFLSFECVNYVDFRLQVNYWWQVETNLFFQQSQPNYCVELVIIKQSLDTWMCCSSSSHFP